MEVTQQTLIILLVSCFTFGFLVWVLMLKNFTINYLKVRFSGGKKKLGHIINPGGNYYVTGEFDKSHFHFTARSRKDNKEPKRYIYIDSYQNAFYRSFGVDCIDVDDVKDSYYSRYNESYMSTPGHNSEYFDELLKTAAAKPSEEGIGFFNAKTWQAIILLCILICGGLTFMTYKNTKTTMERQVMLHDEHVNIAILLNETNTKLDQILISGDNNIKIPGGSTGITIK